MDQDDGQQRTNTSARRQALNACDACRQRKTKCDEGKPSCGRCVRLSLACMYAETVTSQKYLSVAELNGTLKRIEQKLDNLADSRSQRGIGEQESTVQADSQAGGDIQPRHTGCVAPSELALPERHSTAPQHLLSWPCSPLKLNGHELRYPLDMEVRQGKLPRNIDPPRCVLPTTSRETNWVSNLSLSQLRELTRHYFVHFHSPYLILDEATFYSHHLNNALQNDFSSGIDSCLVLLVLALGAAAASDTGNDEWVPLHSANASVEAGLAFFHLASGLFQEAEAPDWTSVQCLLLMGYEKPQLAPTDQTCRQPLLIVPLCRRQLYSSKLRVYDAWRRIHQACSLILVLLPLEYSLQPLHCHLYWDAYLHESQFLVEFDFPPSGLSRLESAVPLPIAPELRAGSHHQHDQFYFLALIALRRLLNSIHVHLYTQEREDTDSRNQTPGPSSLPSRHTDKFLLVPHSVISELDRQLEEWRACLPANLLFAGYAPSLDTGVTELDGSRPTHERVMRSLKARYFAAKSIIYRPSLYRLLHHVETEPLPNEDMAGARIAVHAALLSVRESGLLYEPIGLLLHPINSWRTSFALAVQVAFLLRGGELCRAALPRGWEVVQRIREQVGVAVSLASPSAARDYEILGNLG
ncbi:hypothetical protein GE09DRAFT_1288638 [Coniochaeta sp. 2T2.1]|nr:hypothetical protein GE09DRAFT_1288638 [Coniochaeta sp. 2T2.1]